MLVNELNALSQDDSQILHPGSRALFRFWERARAERSAPNRSELDLQQIRDIVPSLFIVERDSRTRSFRWRLAGTSLCNLMRRELTGRSIFEGWDSFEANVIGRFMESATAGLQPCLLRMRLHTDLGEIIGVELLGLPVQAREGGAVQVFGGVFVFASNIDPYYGAITAMELSAARHIWTEHLPGDRLMSQLEMPLAREFRPFRVIKGGRVD